MSKDPTRRLVQARMEVEQAKKRLASTRGALQYRLSPGTIANNAWEGVRGKSSDLADDALQAVKDRPATASGIVAGFLIFLARDPLWSLVSGWFRAADEDLVTTRLDDRDDNYDLTAPEIDRPVVKEGVNA